MQSARYYLNHAPLPQLQPPEQPRRKRPNTSLRVFDLLSELEQRYAEQENVTAAKAWRRSIGGVCLDKAGKRVTCIEIDGVQQTAHWLIHWLNGKL